MAVIAHDYLDILLEFARASLVFVARSSAQGWQSGSNVVCVTSFGKRTSHPPGARTSHRDGKTPIVDPLVSTGSKGQAPGHHDCPSGSATSGVRCAHACARAVFRFKSLSSAVMVDESSERCPPPPPRPSFARGLLQTLCAHLARLQASAQGHTGRRAYAGWSRAQDEPKTTRAPRNEPSLYARLGCLALHDHSKGRARAVASKINTGLRWWSTNQVEVGVALRDGQ